jgi:hypothetical protein
MSVEGPVLNHAIRELVARDRARKIIGQARETYSLKAPSAVRDPFGRSLKAAQRTAEKLARHPVVPAAWVARRSTQLEVRYMVRSGLTIGRTNGREAFIDEALHYLSCSISSHRGGMAGDAVFGLFMPHHAIARFLQRSGVPIQGDQELLLRHLDAEARHLSREALSITGAFSDGTLDAGSCTGWAIPDLSGKGLWLGRSTRSLVPGYGTVATALLRTYLGWNQIPVEKEGYLRVALTSGTVRALADFPGMFRPNCTAESEAAAAEMLRTLRLPGE